MMQIQPAVYVYPSTIAAHQTIATAHQITIVISQQLTIVISQHIELHGTSGENGGLLGGFHRAWLKVKKVFSSKDDQVILTAVVPVNEQ